MNSAERYPGKKIYQLVWIKFNAYTMHSALLLSDTLQGHKHQLSAWKANYKFRNFKLKGKKHAQTGHPVRTQNDFKMRFSSLVDIS